MGIFKHSLGKGDQLDEERERNLIAAMHEARKRIEGPASDGQKSPTDQPSPSSEERAAKRIDESPAGQGSAGAIIGAIVTIFIILLITDLLGLTDIFPFVKRHKNENRGS